MTGKAHMKPVREARNLLLEIVAALLYKGQEEEGRQVRTNR